MTTTFPRAARVSAGVMIGLAGLAMSAQAGITGIYSNVVGASNNAVPGGTVFNPGTTSSSAFDRPYVSPDGLFWVVGATQDDPTDDKDVVIRGSGSSGGGALLVAREDDAVPFETGTTWSFFRTRLAVNNSGQVAFSADTTAATSSDDMIVVYSPGSGTYAPLVRESGASPIAGQAFGTPNDSVHLTASGQVLARSGLSPTTTKQIATITGGGVLAETDVTIPTGQLVAPAQSLDNLQSERTLIDSTGTNFLYRADLNGPTTTDDIIVYNGAVVIQEGNPLPGSGIASNVQTISGDAGSNVLSHNGTTWAARVTLADTTDVVFKNGAVAARTDLPIFAGSTELFDDAIFTATFFANAVNGNGDVLIGGTTNNVDLLRNAVLVFNNSFVVAREGDAVDLNGDGLLNDDAFIDTFGNDDLVLTDDLRAFAVISVRNAAGVATGNAFVTFAVPSPSAGAMAAIGMAMMGRRRRR